MTHVPGASADADQALVSDGAPADRHPTGFDPSRDPSEIMEQVARSLLPQGMPQPDTDLLRGAEEAAKFLGLSRRQIYRMTESGNLPHAQIGRRIFYKKSALIKLFEAADSPASGNAAIAVRHKSQKPIGLPEGFVARSVAVAIELVADELEIPSEHRAAFIGRCRNLIRVGLLGNESLGRGKADAVSIDKFARLKLAAHFTICGIAPAKIVRLLGNDDPLMRDKPPFVLTSEYGTRHTVVVSLADARDSDRSGEAGETRSGSTEGESAGPQGIAQPLSGDPSHD